MLHFGKLRLDCEALQNKEQSAACPVLLTSPSYSEACHEVLLVLAHNIRAGRCLQYMAFAHSKQQWVKLSTRT